MAPAILVIMLKFIIVTLLFSFAFTYNIPSYVHLCKRNDPELAKCFVNTINEIKPYLSSKGIPEMNLPPIEPFKIESIKFHSSDRLNSVLDVEIVNGEIENVSSFNMTKFALDLDKGYFTAQVVIKNLKCNAKYTVKGKLMIFTLDGEGDLKFDIGEVIGNAEWHAKSYMKDGKEHFKFQQSNITTELSGFVLQFENLFKDKALTDHFNSFINQNMDTLLPEFSPIVHETINLFALRYLNDVYDVFPLDVLYPID